MNRADRRREAKLQKPGKKAAGSTVDAAVAAMIEPIVVLLNAQEFVRAEVALKELLAAAPNHAEGHHLYGLLLSQTERAAEGITSLQRATLLEPGMALYWHNLATAYSRSRQFDAGIEAARRATKLDPAYVDAQYLLTNLLLAEVNLAEGGDELAKLVTMLPDNGKLWQELGRIRLQQTRQSEGLAAYERAVALMPNDSKLLRELSEIYMNTWEYEKAQKLRRQADEVDGIKGN